MELPKALAARLTNFKQLQLRITLPSHLPRCSPSFLLEQPELIRELPIPTSCHLLRARRR